MSNQLLLKEHEIRFKRIVRRAFLLPIGVMIVASIVLAWLVGYLLTVTNWVDHTDRVLAQANLSEKLILNLETGLRRYQITGNAAMLESFHQAEPEIERQLDILGRLVSDNPSQVQRVKGIHSALNEWKIFARDLMGRRERNEDYQGFKINAKEKTLMDTIQSNFENFIQIEAGLRKKRVDVVQQIDHTIQKFRFIVLIIIGLGIAYYVQRQLNHVARIYESTLETTRQKAEALQKSEASLKEAENRLRKYADELEQIVKQRTVKLQETIAELEAYSYSVSHDLRAPLRAMQGYSKVLLDECGQDLKAEAQVYLKRIVVAAERMDRLIQDVLTYSRVARSELVLEPVDLGKLINEIIPQYPVLNFPKTQIVIDGPLPQVTASEASLTQCFSNLLTNAVKFVPEDRNPRVRIWAEQAGSCVKIWIEDNGIGIAPEYQNRIFGMFERIPSENAYEGTGVGLAIVRKAVERMGGQVGVESAVNKGSRFWILLPETKI
ncbi:MAG: hypothetical protein JWQ71_1489 [Pedosphaera sp.]|nr:hypothetical protein [Pedosphaera sp.]